MEYKILVDDLSKGLTEQVEKAISKGWKPLGGVAIATRKTTDKDGYTIQYCIFAQAIVKE